MKMKIITFCLLLILCFPLTVYAEKQTICFGEYPQTKVSDKTVMDNLEKLSPDGDSSVRFNGNCYYMKENNGSKEWFLYEPVEWIVLDSTNGGTFVLSKKILDSCGLSKSWDDTAWDDSIARKWLNTTFYKRAFTVEEQKCIYTTNVINDRGDDTRDKIYYPTAEDLRNAKYGFNSADDRTVECTEFSGANTYLTRTTSSIIGLGVVCGVYSWNGYMCDVPIDAWWGARPCMKINLAGAMQIEKEKEEAKPKDFTKAAISLAAKEYTYDGKSKTPAVTVKYDGKKLSSTDYSVTYKNNKYVGTASVIIKGKGVYSGTVTRTFKIKSPGKITVKFNANGGAVSGKTKKVNRGSRYGKLPSPTRKGYTFAGWYTAAKNGKRVTESSYVTVSKTQTVYALWKKNTYTIKYVLNKGTNAKSNPASYTVTSKKIVFKNPTRTGYTFRGWYSDSKYKKKVTGIGSGSTGNRTLYAKWSVNSYNIVFDGNGSTSGFMDQMSNIPYGKEQPIKRNQFLKKGYVFSGWSTKKGGKREYTDGQIIKNLSAKAGYTIVLYACWNKATDEKNNIFGKFISNIDGKKHSYGAVYSDGYFIKPTGTRNPDLAVLSMVASASAYYGDCSKEFLKDCGFKNVVYNYSSSTLKSPTKTDNDHVGYTFGTKYLKDKNTTVVAVLVKGTSKDAEWYSNFNMGTDAVHRGFKLATDEVYKNVNKSIDNLKNKGEIKGKIKIWVTGHSRGAAVANLLGVSFNSKYGSSNVYTYTFATPRTINTKKINKSVPNIFNYLNPGDFVTEVVPSAWNFGRYGEDVPLSDSVKEFMEIKFYNLTGKAYTGFGIEGKKSLVKAFVKYGKSQNDYDVERNIYHDLATGSSYRISAKNYCYDVLAAFLSGNTTSALKALAAYSVASPESVPISVKMIVDGKINSKFRDAHSIDSYLTWLDAMY